MERLWSVLSQKSKDDYKKIADRVKSDPLDNVDWHSSVGIQEYRMFLGLDEVPFKV